MADQSNIQSAASKSIRPFKSSEEYLYAMREDLAEWLNALYGLDLSVDSFMDGLETGCILCQHANNVNRAALVFQRSYPETAHAMRLPAKDVVFQARNVAPGTFVARDNISNFIDWCRHELGIKEVLMFETNDLVQRCNEKNFVLCLLEVARRGAKFGMPAPMLIQLEEEIEEEIRDQENLGESSPPNQGFSREDSMGEIAAALYSGWQQKRVLCDMRNLDELVREILGKCSCPSQFPMTKVSEGKYKVGDSSALIFIRVLRTHVMVRVGGGWDTLEHYLDKHDPCRCSAFAHRYQQSKPGAPGTHSKSSSAHSSRSTSPGPHWRNETINSERRTQESSAAPACGRPGRPHRPSLPMELDTTAHRGATLLPRPPWDHSEPRHLNSKVKDIIFPSGRRLSGDSDSSTTSSKGGGGGARTGSRPPRRSDEEVVLLVSRKEGKHIIERPTARQQNPSLRVLQTRARSHSRERPSEVTLKPHPPQGRSVSGTPRTERGRSLAPEGPHRLQSAPRSLSQGKMPASPRIRNREPMTVQASDRAVPRRTQTNGSSHSPARGSPSKKVMPLTHTPTMGRGKVLTPVYSRVVPWPNRPSAPIHQHPEEEVTLPFQLFPSLDPQQEHDLYRSFEAEFLANAAAVSQQQEMGLLLPQPPDPNVSDSAYSSSSSSTSSLNTAAKAGLLPELRETRRGETHPCPLEDVPALDPAVQQWADQGFGLKKLPAIPASINVSRDNSPIPLSSGDKREDKSGQEDNQEETGRGSNCASAPLSEEGSSSDGSSSSRSSRAGTSGVVLRPKKGLRKPERVPSIYKLKLRPRIRPRTDNRPENSPSRIPTPISYANCLSPSHKACAVTRDCSTSSLELEDEGWM